MPVKLDANPNGEFGNQPIILAEIKALVKNYRDTMPDPADAKSAWVSASELLQLIGENNGNGVRIYYGRHPKGDPKFPGLHNVILVATLDKINPGNPSTENSVDLLSASGKVVNSVSYSGEGDDAIPLCPPACPTGGGL